MSLVREEFERLVMDDGDWYELRTQLGFYRRAEVSDGMALTIHMPWSVVRNGVDAIDDERVPMTLERQPKIQMKRLYTYIARWSHPEPKNWENIQNIPPRHAKKLLDRIEELEAAQDGPAEDSPLDEPSAVSLEALSYRVEPPSV